MSARRFGSRFEVTAAAALVACVSALACAGAANAQFPDVLSEAECAGCAAALASAPFEGTWSTALTAVDATGWELADLFCVTACTPEARAEVTAVLADPRNAQRSAAELYPQLEGLSVRPLRFGCDTLGLADQAVSPWPVSIRREVGRVVFRYEERGAVRRIALDDGASGGAAAPLGVSTARVEHGVLVVDTRTATLHAIERYTASADGRWLTLDLAVQRADSREPPRTATKRWVRTPSARLAAQHCDVMTAGLAATPWDFVDARQLEAQRAALVTRVARDE